MNEEQKDERELPTIPAIESKIWKIAQSKANSPTQLEGTVKLTDLRTY